MRAEGEAAPETDNPGVSADHAVNLETKTAAAAVTGQAGKGVHHHKISNMKTPLRKTKPKEIKELKVAWTIN